jgi:hypothetical protein
MRVFRRLVRYFFWLKYRERLPRVPRFYATEYDPRQVDRHDADLMRLAAARDPGSARVLEKRRRMSAQQLARLLDVPRPRRSPRLLPLLRHISGTTAYDPLKRFYRNRKR